MAPMARSSIGQDTALSRLKDGFDSRTRYQILIYANKIEFLRF
jgi:hypothetical protein